MHETKTATRWPLNFTHANLVLRGTTPEGIEIEFEVGRVVFKEPDDAVIIEIHDNDPIVVPIDKVTHSGRSYMVDLRGTVHSVEGSELFTAKVQQPEDLERLVDDAHPKPDDLFPEGWSDPKDWS